MAQVPPMTAAAPSVSSSLSIGAFTFWYAEHPKELPFGIEQKLAVYELIGGGKQVQSLGAFGKPVTWTGRLWNDSPYGDVNARVALLERLTAEGLEQRLTWRTRRFDVVIKELDVKYANQFEAEYTITVEVLRDAANANFGSQRNLPIDAQLSSLYTQSGRAAVTLTSIDPTTMPMIQANLANVGLLDPQVARTMTTASLAASAKTAAAMLQTYIAQATTTLQAATAARTLLASVQTTAKNLTIASASQTVRIVDGEFTALASRFYKRPDLGHALQAANGEPALTFSGSRNITLPPVVTLEGM